MKLGLDVHGVIDAEPAFFSFLSKTILLANGEVHIITGTEDSEHLRTTLTQLNIHYTHFFSISSYHKSIGTKMWYTDPNNPWCDEVVWNRTKGDYCARNKIDFHIDDSPEYQQYFTTPFLLFQKRTV